MSGGILIFLKEIVSLPDNDIQAMISFFETNGFFFKVGDANFESLSLEDVVGIINRLKATVALMNEIESPEIDYERMVSLTLYLLLSQQISIELSTLPRPYVSCRHFLSNEIGKASQLPEIDGQQEAFQTDTYTIRDPIYGSYSVLKMGPTWRVPNLISALYFSVFYLRPGTDAYRKCANPACNNRFVVKTTNGRKKYCCANCRNATAQRNHRKKMKTNKI